VCCVLCAVCALCCVLYVECAVCAMCCVLCDAQRSCSVRGRETSVSGQGQHCISGQSWWSHRMKPLVALTFAWPSGIQPQHNMQGTTMIVSSPCQDTTTGKVGKSGSTKVAKITCPVDRIILAVWDTRARLRSVGERNAFGKMMTSAARRGTKEENSSTTTISICRREENRWAGKFALNTERSRVADSSSASTAVYLI
jgi:hypothetical protein